MPDASTSRSQLLIRTEGAFNEALPNAANGFRALRFTKESLKHAKDTVVSNEIRADRAKSDLLQVGVGLSGGFSFEVSGDSFTDILEASCGSVFTPTAGNANLATIGQPTSLFRSFGMERGQLDLPLFYYFGGVCMNQLTLNMPSKSIVTADATVMGIVGYAPTTVTGANPAATAANTNPVFTSGPGINNILVNGLPIGVGVKEIKLVINNNLRTRETVDSLQGRQFGRGDFDVTGTLTMYMSNPALYNYFLANTGLSLSFTISDNLHKALDFVLPVIKSNDDDAAAITGGNADVMETFQFRALYDPVSGQQLLITKRSF